MRKKALITGGEYGMGRGIALVLAEEGYDIAFSYYMGVQNDEKAVKTTKKLLAVDSLILSRLLCGRIN